VPTYDYKCKACGDRYVDIHSIKQTSQGCPSCQSPDVEKVISPFSAATERSLERVFDKYQQQAVKDNQRFHKDDTFAANITGADDPNHNKKLSKVLADQQAKADAARQKIKRVESK
jgi:putative FmdB family regulatory protein